MLRENNSQQYYSTFSNFMSITQLKTEEILTPQFSVIRDVLKLYFEPLACSLASSFASISEKICAFFYLKF
jgi:hypothetical protein